MLRKNNNQKGFTIIEVVITIAIGAAIMALVLNAVQGARRSQRNTNRTADVSAIAGAISQFHASRNALPTQWSDMSALITDNDLAHYQGSVNINTGGAGAYITGVTLVPGSFPVLPGTPPAGAMKVDETSDTLIIYRAAECLADNVAGTAAFNTLVDTGSVRQMVIVHTREGDDNWFCEEV